DHVQVPADYLEPAQVVLLVRPGRAGEEPEKPARHEGERPGPPRGPVAEHHSDLGRPPRRARKSLDAPPEALLDPPRQRAAQPGPARQLRRGQPAGHPPQRQRTAPRRGDDPTPPPRIQLPGQRRAQQRPRILLPQPPTTSSGTPARSPAATRAANTSPTGSAPSRRAANASTCAEARSSHCASSTTHTSGRSPATSDSKLRLPYGCVPGHRPSAMERLEGVVHEEGRPHERLEHANGAFAWALRLLPVPHQRADQPETVDGLAGRRRLRALSLLLLLHNASLRQD